MSEIADNVYYSVFEVSLQFFHRIPYLVVRAHPVDYVGCVRLLLHLDHAHCPCRSHSQSPALVEESLTSHEPETIRK